MTRATGGPVRCPWCARPVSDGPGSPDACPSCGVPLSPAVLEGTVAPVAPPRAPRLRRSQRLRALATVLALTAVMLILSAIGVAAALIRVDHRDERAKDNLQQMVLTAQAVLRETGSYTHATPGTLHARVPSVSVVDSGVASADERVVSMAVTPAGDGWFGAVKSRSGRCYMAGTVDANPELTLVLPNNVNCTGDAARAVFMPPGVPSSTMTAAPR